MEFDCDNIFNDIENNKHYEIMDIAINEAKTAVNNNEVPVGCVIVEFKNNVSYDYKVIAKSYNKTNQTGNATKHCEINCFEQLKIIKNPKRTILYVTLEPCIMCAFAINLMNIKYVIFGGRNNKFGGNGSLMNIDTLKPNPYLSRGGYRDTECVKILQDFYINGNMNIEENQRHRKKIKNNN